MSTADDFADLLAGRLKMQCTVCGADMGKCDCWTKCTKPGCKWSYLKGTKCRNPAHSSTQRKGEV